MMTLETLIIALGLAFIIEGFFPACFPNKWQKYVAKLAEESPANIRQIGVTIMLIGVALIYFI